MPSESDVIIIGAGAAGLSAAKKLESARTDIHVGRGITPHWRDVRTPKKSRPAYGLIWAAPGWLGAHPILLLPSRMSWASH